MELQVLIDDSLQKYLNSKEPDEAKEIYEKLIIKSVQEGFETVPAIVLNKETNRIEWVGNLTAIEK